MRKPKRPDPKREALKESRTLNPHPDRVSDTSFAEHDFFDPRDLLQVKYEMLRRARIEGRSIRESAERFGFSRPSFYTAQRAFEEDGLAGLLPRRRGPRGPHKLTAEALEFLQRALGEDRSLRGADLARLVEERFGVRAHPRSIERALARRQKKRRRSGRA